MLHSAAPGGVPDRNPVHRLFRNVIQERLRRLYPRSSRVLDLECGWGEDAAFLASQGVVVHALDPSRENVERARAMAAELGIARSALRFEQRTPGELAGLAPDAPFDGAYSSRGILAGVDLAALGRGLACLLRPGSPILLALATSRNNPDAGHPTLRAVRDSFGGAFQWTDGFGLGILVPGPARAAWVTHWPQAFGLLAAVEGLVRHWPGLRRMAHVLVVQGVRVAGERER